MSRTYATLMACFVSVLLAASAFAADAEAERPRGPRAIWGTVTKASAESVTIAPEAPAVRRNRRQPAAAAEKPPEKPPERMFALAKDQTELAFAEVGMQRPMNDGTMLRTLNDPEPATAADLKVGQLAQVTPTADDAGVAKMIIIAWSTPGTIVKVEGDELTFRPAAPGAAPTAAGDNAAPKSNEPAANATTTTTTTTDDQTLTISKTGTRVTIARVADERPSPSGRGIVQSIEYKPGTLADLKPDQAVVICIKNETAAKITIHVSGNAKP